MTNNIKNDLPGNNNHDNNHGRGEDMTAFYEEKLLKMAEELEQEKAARPLGLPGELLGDALRAAVDGSDFAKAAAAAPHVGEKHNRLCGSTMNVAFWLQQKNGEESIAALFLKPQSCLLGRVSAALCERNLVGENLAGIKLVRGLLRDLLAGRRADMPKPFDGFSVFAAVRYLQNRHSAILLPLDVIIDTWEKDKIQNA
ncbi:MAG: hypothetical protein QM529_01555 [Hydrotalea sp.]|nr:hypothetical protein [Hydrotalea sp.]